MADVSATCATHFSQEPIDPLPDDNPPILRLIPLEGNGEVTCVYDLPFLIGRGKTSDLMINGHNVVSRAHCTLKIDKSLVFVEDSSSYGSYVNDRKITKGKRMVIIDKDVICLAARTEYAKWREVCWQVLMPVQPSDPDAPLLVHERVGDYVLLETIGEGQNGSAHVRAAVHSVSGERFACKIMPHDSVEAGMLMRHQHFDAMKAISHPNLTRMIEFIDSHHIYIIMELAEGGDLFTFFVDNRGSSGGLEENIIQEIILDVLHGLVHLHEHSIIHRDVKTENILLKYSGHERRWQLSDFGFVRKLNTSVDERAQTFCGTEQYMSPGTPTLIHTHYYIEVMTAKKYTLAADLWSLGVVMYTLVTGCFAFDGEAQLMRVIGNKNPNNALENALFSGKRAHLFDNVSQDAVDFMMRLIVIDPDDRMSAQDALKHKWIKYERPTKKIRK